MSSKAHKLVFNYTAHKKLWGLIAENPSGDCCHIFDFKEELIKLYNLSAGQGGLFPINGCYACDVGFLYSPCRCPLDWGVSADGKCFCESYGTAYADWFYAATNMRSTNWDRHGSDALELVSTARRVRDVPLSDLAEECDVI